MFHPSTKTLTIYQIVAHLVLLYALITGTLLSWILSILVYFLLATIGGTVTYHRLLSHKSFVTSKWFEWIGTLCGTIGGNGSSIAWVAVHREHHRFTDTERDPHSPHWQNLFRIQFASMLEEPKLRYVPDLLRSKFHLWTHKNYWLINIIYVTIVYAVFGAKGVVFGYFVPTLLVWHAGSAINTVNHLWGYRTNNTRDKSTNNLLTGILVSGEGWHNNHHAHPADAKFGRKWWEIDIGWWIIKLARKKNV